MIEVVVNILPQGDSSRRRRLATMTISNISDLADNSDYVYMVVTEASELTGADEQNHGGMISNHNRFSSIWSLIRKVLNKEKSA